MSTAFYVSANSYDQSATGQVDQLILENNDNQQSDNTITYSGGGTATNTDNYKDITRLGSIINNQLTITGNVSGDIIYGANSYLDVTARTEANASSSGDASADADSRASATTISSVIANTILNKSSVTINNTHGIELYADSSAEAYAYATANAYADSDSAFGGTAYPYTNTSAIANATSLVNTNTITNQGRIDTEYHGINLYSWAWSYADTQNNSNVTHGANGSGGDAYEYSNAYAQIYNNTISNSGTILVSDGEGITLEAYAGMNEAPTSQRGTAEINGNTITNTGLISAYNDAIRLWARADGTSNSWSYVHDNTIINSGRIYSLDSGIHITSNADNNENGELYNNTITNTGRIIAADTGIHIWSPYVYSNTINVSGVVISDPGMGLNNGVITKSDKADWSANAYEYQAAISIRDYYSYDSGDSDYNNTINLSAPGYLAGRVLVDSDSMTDVNLTSGRSHSVRWAFQNDWLESGLDANEARYSVNQFFTHGANPWFHNYIADDVNNRNNDVYATIDPTNFASAANQLSDLSGMVSNLARSGLNKDTKATGGVWLNAQGGRTDYSAGAYTLDQKNDLYGVAVGYNNTVMNDVRMGVLAGYSNQKMRAGSAWSDLYSHSYDNKSTGGYVGATASKAFDRVVVDLGLAVGYQSHDDRRFVNDNLQWYGQSYANSSYNSVWYSPEIGVSVPFNVIDETITLAPNVRVNWTGQHIEGYTETGSNSNAKIDSRNIGVVESRIGLDLTKKVNGASLTVSGGYLNRSMTGSDSVKVTMIGDTNNVGYFYKDINAGYVKGSASINLGKNVEAAINGTYTKGGDIEGGNASGTLKINF